MTDKRQKTAKDSLETSIMVSARAKARSQELKKVLMIGQVLEVCWLGCGANLPWWMSKIHPLNLL